MSEPKSKFSELHPPKFQSSIPEHLMAQMEDRDRHVAIALSILEQENAYLQQVVIEHREAIRDLDVRLQTVETWKMMLTSKWSIVVVILALVSPIVLSALVDHYLGH